MKRWALLTLLLYFICLSILTVPVLLALSGKDWEMLPFFYIYIVPVLVLVQGVLLLVPIDISRERPVRRRKVAVSAAIGAIPMAALAVGFLGSIAFMFWGDSVLKSFSSGLALIITAMSWLTWGVLFYRNFSIDEPGTFTSHITRWLLKGSILELLVAIPSHIISRQRDDCCAPPLILFGIATGLAIALMSFGPGVYFLFAQRIRAKMGKQAVSVVQVES